MSEKADRVLDEKDNRHGRLTVLERSTNRNHRARWVCRCECGAVVEVAGGDLRSGNTRSCGCLANELLAERSITHGHTSKGKGKTLWNMFTKARRRAREKGIPFGLTFAEFGKTVIPEKCPVLGIPMFPQNDKTQDGSPTLDRIVPSLGYTDGNVWIISAKANRIKSDATPEEIALVGLAVLAAERAMRIKREVENNAKIS